MNPSKIRNRYIILGLANTPKNDQLTSGNLLCLRSSTRSCRRLARLSGRDVKTFSDKLNVVKLQGRQGEKSRLNIFGIQQIFAEYGYFFSVAINDRQVAGQMHGLKK